MKKQEFFGNLPYPSDRKKPTLVREKDHKLFIFSPEVPEESNLVTVAVSTDQLHCGLLEMGAGSNWHFVDEHLGDEIYFILSGNLTELECNTGECVEAYPGDMLYIPEGCKHRGYNFSENILRLFWVIVPEIWPEETNITYPLDKIRIYKNGKDIYNLADKKESEFSLRKELKLFKRDVNQLGQFPLPGKEARRNPIHYYVMNKNNCLTTVFGLKYPMRLRFFISNDYMDAGEFYLPSGGVGSRVSEVDIHDGDAVIYGLQGPITVFFPDKPGVSYQVKENNLMFIPEGTKYQFINYNSHPLKGYFAVAKNLDK